VVSKIIIEDRGDLGLVELQKQVDRLMAAGNAGRFKLSEKSLAALQAPEDKLPEAALSSLFKLKDIEYQTRESFMSAMTACLNEVDIRGEEEQKRILEVVQSKAENTKVVRNLFSVFRANTPQLFVDLNRDQCQTMDVNPPMCSVRCRSTWDRFTSTTSTVSAAPGR